MKILQINSVCGVGSTGRIATDLYKVLEEQGHECKIAYGRGTAQEEINSIRIGSNLDNYMHVFKTRVFDKHGFASVNATKKFIDEVKEYDPDIIHLHNIHGYYINIEILFNYLKKANKPIVWTMHDCWAFTGHCAYFDYIGCNKWKSKCSNCKQKKVYPNSKLLDNSMWNYEKKKALFTSVKNMTIVTPSEWLAELVKESFLGKFDVRVINNGIDIQTFKPTKNDFKKQYGLEDKFIVLGVASDWTERKGLKYFLKMQQILDHKYKIVLVGVDEKQSKKISKEILVIPKTKNVNELIDIYSAADIFVNPTLEDNFPTTNIEAIACGTPVITFKTGGSIESIDEKTGIVTKNKSEKDIISSIYKLNNKEKYKINCRNRAEKLYDKNKKFKEYIYLYDEINKGNVGEFE